MLSEQEKKPWKHRVFKALMAEAVGFEPTCPCGQLHFECSSLQPLRYASVYKYSLLGTNHMISSAAPSTTRTTLRVLTLFYNFFSHFQPQLSLAFQKFSGSRGEKRREKRDYAKNMKSKKLVFMRVCGQKLSMNPWCFRVRAVITTSIPLRAGIL